MRDTIKEIRDTIKEMRDTLKEMRDTIKAQGDRIDTLEELLFQGNLRLFRRDVTK